MGLKIEAFKRIVQQVNTRFRDALQRRVDTDANLIAAKREFKYHFGLIRSELDEKPTGETQVVYDDTSGENRRDQLSVVSPGSGVYTFAIDIRTRADLRTLPDTDSQPGLPTSELWTDFHQFVSVVTYDSTNDTFIFTQRSHQGELRGTHALNEWEPDADALQQVHDPESHVRILEAVIARMPADY